MSPQTIKQINDAVARLRAKYTKSNGTFELLYADADDFVKSLAGLTRMLGNPRLKPILAQLESYRKGTVGDLIAFMQSFNLRFAPATSSRQSDIYHQLVPMLDRVSNDSSGASTPTVSAPPGPSNPLGTAARQVFHNMSWKHLDVPPRPE